MKSLLILLTICISSVSFGQKKSATITYEKLTRTLQCSYCSHTYSFDLYNLISVNSDYQKYAEKTIDSANKGELLRILNKTTSKNANRPLEFCNNMNYRECKYEVSNEKIEQKNELFDFTEFIDADNLKAEQTRELVRVASMLIIKMAEKADHLMNLKDTVNSLFSQKEYITAYQKHSLWQDLAREIISCLGETADWYKIYGATDWHDAEELVKKTYRKIEEDHFKSNYLRMKGDTFINEIIKYFDENISTETLNTLNRLIEFVNTKQKQSTYGLGSSIDYKSHSDKLESCMNNFLPKYMEQKPLTDFEKQLTGEYKLKSKPFFIEGGSGKFFIKSNLIIKNNRQMIIEYKLKQTAVGAIVRWLTFLAGGGLSSNTYVTNKVIFQAHQKENNLIHFDCFYSENNRMVKDIYECIIDGQGKIIHEHPNNNTTIQLVGKKIK